MKRILQILSFFLLFDISANSQQSLQIKFYDIDGNIKIVNYKVKRPKIA
ncbi:hypothetical protein JGI12_01632, partial [Candidatus Kryptonium thompsonii]